MTVPLIDPFEGDIRDISPQYKYSPYTAAWWSTTTVARVPENAVGWMVAQGWQVTSSFEEDDEQFYAMTRQSMQSWQILQAILNEYTQAFNEGRSANSVRYNDIIKMMVNALSTVRENLDTLGDISDGHVSLYVSQMDTLVSGVETEIALAKADMTAAGDTMAEQLADYMVTLDTLQGIYDAHEVIAKGYLTDLGTTELARINEAFDAELAKQKQGLVTRGMYSAYLFTDVQTRITRERNEAISALNDKLAREKLGNQHTLYGQEIGVSGNILDGKMQASRLTAQNSQFLIDARSKLAMAVMEAQMQRARGTMDIRDREEKLMAYQISEHTGLAVGLWGFMERRVDSYPSLETMTQLIAGLGDAGGSWITP